MCGGIFLVLSSMDKRVAVTLFLIISFFFAVQFVRVIIIERKLIIQLFITDFH